MNGASPKHRSTTRNRDRPRRIAKCIFQAAIDVGTTWLLVHDEEPVSIHGMDTGSWIVLALRMLRHVVR